MTKQKRAHAMRAQVKTNPLCERSSRLFVCEFRGEEAIMRIQEKKGRKKSKESKHWLAGALRFETEFGDNEKQAGEYTRTYKKLVEKAANLTKKDADRYFTVAKGLGKKLDASESERTVVAILDETMKKKLGMKFTHKQESCLLTLAQSLYQNLWDCDNADLFVFDVLRQLGKKPSIIYVQSHTFLKLEHLCYEPERGVFFPNKDLEKNYKIIYFMTNQPEGIRSLTHLENALRRVSVFRLEQKQKHIDEAIEELGKSLALNYENGVAHIMLGICYLLIQENDRAARHLRESVRRQLDGRLYSAIMELSEELGIADRIDIADLIRVAEEHENMAAVFELKKTCGREQGHPS